MFNVKVAFKLFKRRRDPNKMMKTKSKTFTAYPFTGVASSPGDLYCPQWSTLIYTASHSFLKTNIISGPSACAELCNQFRDEDGNAPCYSWTYNSWAVDKFGLEAGDCRLFPNEDVVRVNVPGVVSGHKDCWEDSYEFYDYYTEYDYSG